MAAEASRNEVLITTSGDEGAGLSSVGFLRRLITATAIVPSAPITAPTVATIIGEISFAVHSTALYWQHYRRHSIRNSLRPPAAPFPFYQPVKRPAPRSGA